WRGRHIGDQLLPVLIAEAGRLELRKLLSRVFLVNKASRALCQKHGFREVGIYEKHGKPDGQWLDVVIVERLIAATPT
ncbi:MAG: GNAT family N-acetyltransferase, partial [Planctomycetaceae bacterium]